MRPEKLRLSPAFSLPLGLPDVSRFASACLSAGLEVECTAVASPEVDVDAAKELCGAAWCELSRAHVAPVGWESHRREKEGFLGEVGEVASNIKNGARVSLSR